MRKNTKMLKQLFARFLQPRHFWRTVGFDELSELYVSNLLRSMGINLIGLFIPIYLYKLGYSVRDIAFYFVCWFVFRLAFDYISARLVAKFGPKHVMLGACFMHVFYLILVITLKSSHWPFLLVASVGSFAYSLHLIAFQVDFSKIKHAEHGGKELGYITVMDKIGGVAGPLIGGFIANAYDPRYTVGLSIVVLLCSAVPLFFTKEAVATSQKLSYAQLPIRKHYRDYLSAVPTTVENTISLIVWPLFVAIYILKDNVYAKLGVVIAASTLSSILLTRMIGGLIDRRKGLQLLRTGVVLNALVHLARPFVGSFVGVLGVNVVNEPITAAYRMPYTKGLYDTADSLPGYRIAYLSSYIMVDSLSRLGFWLCVWFVLGRQAIHTVFVSLFVVAAVASIGILVERFAVLHAVDASK
jgi:hypothetical protein